MILDSRIKAGKKPLTCLDVEEAKQFEGKLCLFSSSFVNYKNIREYAKHPQYTGILAIRDKFDSLASEEYPYRNGHDGYFYEFILPLEWIENPKDLEYEPYTLDTWLQDFKPGDIVVFISEEGNYFEFMYSGYVKHPDNCIRVILGPWLFSFDDLFNKYIINSNGTWEPFGRKTKEG